MQTDADGLHVIENYFVKNDSKPPLTQLSRHAYEIYLPAAAKVEATAAMGPGGMPVSSSPLPVGDPKTDPGHYAFVFPIRPGETRFQVSYHLPYSGSLQFAQRAALTTENLVIMLPKSMQFTPGSSAFQPVPDSVTSQTFVLKGVAAGQSVPFTIAGTGVMPREAQGSDSGATGQGEAGAVGGQAGAAAGQGNPTAAQPESPGAPGTEASADTRPGGGLGPPIDTPDPAQQVSVLDPECVDPGAGRSSRLAAAQTSRIGNGTGCGESGRPKRSAAANSCSVGANRTPNIPTEFAAVRGRRRHEPAGRSKRSALCPRG